MRFGKVTRVGNFGQQLPGGFHRSTHRLTRCFDLVPWFNNTGRFCILPDTHCVVLGYTKECLGPTRILQSKILTHGDARSLGCPVDDECFHTGEESIIGVRFQPFEESLRWSGVAMCVHFVFPSAQEQSSHDPKAHTQVLQNRVYAYKIIVYTKSLYIFVYVCVYQENTSATRCSFFHWDGLSIFRHPRDSMCRQLHLQFKIMKLQLRRRRERVRKHFESSVESSQVLVA